MNSLNSTVWTKRIGTHSILPLLLSEHTLSADVQHKLEHKKILPLSCEQFDVLNSKDRFILDEKSLVAFKMESHIRFVFYEDHFKMDYFKDCVEDKWTG